MSTTRDSGTVRRIWSETPRLLGVVLEVDGSVAARYARPGQVIAVRGTGDHEVHLVIASYPGEAFALELLVGPKAAARLDLAEGRTFDFVGPSGPGFPVEMAEGRDVLVFAVGSAIASVRPLLERFRRSRERYGRIRTYLGAHVETDFPYRAEYGAWMADGIEVTRSVSRPYVQDRFLQEIEAGTSTAQDARRLVESVAYVSGMSAMMDQCTAVLTSLGVKPEHIGRNW